MTANATNAVGITRPGGRGLSLGKKYRLKSATVRQDAEVPICTGYRVAQVPAMRSRGYPAAIAWVLGASCNAKASAGLTHLST